MNDTLAELNLDQYVTLLQQLSGSDSECGIWHNDQLYSSTAGFSLALASDPQTVSKTLYDHLKQPVATLSVANSNTEPTAALTTVHGLLSDSYRLNYDLGTITDELTSRYEDLNLVFDNNEVASGLVDFQIALESLANNALHRMQRGAVILLIPEKQTEIFVAQNAESIHDMTGLREANRSAWWSFIRHTEAQWVQNSDDASDDIAVVDNFGCKLLLSPITSMHGGVLGSLCLVKPRSEANFSNSDKNLAEVICSSAQSIFNANFDALTGLIHRAAFEKELRQRRDLQRNSTAKDVLLFANVDRTQIINDTLGHASGDLLLKSTASKLVASLRRSDIVCRLGSDEFAILLTDIDYDSAFGIANKLCEAVANLRLNSVDESPTEDVSAIQSSVSIGLSVLDYEDSITDGIAQAELASQKAKELGGNQVQAYQADDDLLSARREQMLLVNTIQEAIAADRFELYCQPIVHLGDQTCSPHFEVLLRMRGGPTEIISPGLFLPSAERYSLMPQIDRWVFRNTLKSLHDSGLLIVEPNTVCSVNLSGQTLSDESFADYVTEHMQSVQVNPQNICFEITETTAINDFTMAQTFIDEMKGRGFSFSLDDFGTGLSSFTYLQRMPVNYVKIDGSFVSKITTDPVSRAMVKAIADVARAMNLETIGEFVEDTDIVDALSELGIDYGQGYYFSEPVDLNEYLQQLLEGTSSVQTGSAAESQP